MVRNKKIMVIGLAILFVTSLVYLIDRPAENTLVLSALGIQFPHSPYPIFGDIGSFIPSFGHALSFSLITASLFNYGNAQSIIICFSWFLINVIFEISQMAQLESAKSIPLFYNYMENGTFDKIDIISAGLGSLMAFTLLQFFKYKKTTITI